MCSHATTEPDDNCIPFPYGRAPSTQRFLRDPEIDGLEPLYIEHLPRFRREREVRQRWKAMCRAFKVTIFLYEHEASFRAKYGPCPYTTYRWGSTHISADATLDDAELDAELARVFARIAMGKERDDD